LFYPTAIGWHPEERRDVNVAQHDAWETAQRAHAIANGCYVVAVNRTGFEPDPTGVGGLEFWGQSFVAAPDGSVVVRASSDREEVIVCELDMSSIGRQRVGWPFLRDRRIDAYSELTKRFID
jgi:N-carbamoylputrescine amidase